MQIYGIFAPLISTLPLTKQYARNAM